MVRNLGTLCFGMSLFFTEPVFAAVTSAQKVSKVWVQDDGGTAGPKIYIYTADNNGIWAVPGATGCVDPTAFLIPASSYSKKEWLSVLLTAQSSGQNVVIEFNLPCTGSPNPTAISIQQ